MNPFTEILKRRAREMGLTDIGIARAEPLQQESVRLAEWLSRGYHGTMKWMERNAGKRIDPRDILPGAKSMVVAALNYYSDVHHSDDPRTAKISRYAWGDDYHDVLSAKLEALLRFVEKENPGCHGKIYVDTGPVMEKVWAQRAGIGWEGKHTNVITQDHGSWVFLGVIIVDIELEYDPPATDHCGSCTLCIEACPTQAIVEPYVLDARRCISYLTIEHRGAIDPELGEHFERWVYGCDICQDVCPWNVRFSRPTECSEFEPRDGNTAPDIGSLASMSQQEFSTRFRKSPIKRTKWEGIVRNANVLLSSDISMKEEK